jgi:hypothetical protein
LPNSKWQGLESRSDGRIASLRKELHEKLDRAAGSVEFWITLTYLQIEVAGILRRPLGVGGCLWLQPAHKDRAIGVLRSMSYGSGSSQPLLRVDHPGSRYELVLLLTKHAERTWALEDRWAYAATSNLTRSARSIYEDQSQINEVARDLLRPGTAPSQFSR